LPGKKKDDLNPLRNVPWMTTDGHFDLTKFPIDSTLKQTLSGENQEFRAACRMLASMCGSGRTEAGIFLWGLLAFYRDDLVRKQVIVEALAQFQNMKTAKVLFAELDQIESSNTTRVYIKAILTTLSLFPSRLIEEGFTGLIGDKKWSDRMRRKFQAIVDGVDWRYP
jgi:hypothetical protein